MNYNISDFYIDNNKFYQVEVFLPKTTLLVVGNDKGYFMCGALDVKLFDSKPHLKERKVICGRCMGVKTIEELLHAPLYEVSEACIEFNIKEQDIVKDALLKLV